MPWPLSQDYNEGVQNPASAFGDLELRACQPAVNAMGLPRPRSGNFADVYEFCHPATQRKWAVKCFTRPVSGLRDRYREISAHLRQAQLPFTVDFDYLEQGIRVRGQWHPVLKMHWIEGFTLNEYVKDCADKPKTLETLLQVWLRLAGKLREAQLAHGDLQHGNVLLVPGSRAGALGVKLIDYDGMFVPALAQTPSGEVGHAAFQHPQRLRQGAYNAEVDRFPHLVIATALRSLIVAGPSLWERYDNGDNLLFRAPDFADPAASGLFKELWLWGLNDPMLQALAGRLLLACTEPLERTPLLENLLPGGQAAPLTPSERQRAEALLARGQGAVARTQPALAAPRLAEAVTVTPGPRRQSSSPAVPDWAAAPAPPMAADALRLPPPALSRRRPRKKRRDSSGQFWTPWRRVLVRVGATALLGLFVIIVIANKSGPAPEAQANAEKEVADQKAREAEANARKANADKELADQKAREAEDRARQANAEKAFRYQFVKGEPVQYAIENAFKLKTPEGDYLDETKEQVAWHVLQVEPDNKARMRLIVNRYRRAVSARGGKVDFDSENGKYPDGPLGQALTPFIKAKAAMQATLTLDSQGNVNDLIVAEELKAFGGDMSSVDALRESLFLVPVLPKEPLQKGQSWTQITTSRAPPFGVVVKQATTFVYDGPAGESGKELQKFTITKSRIQESDPKAAMVIKIKSQDSSGQGYFDSAAGRWEEMRVIHNLESERHNQGQIFPCTFQQSVSMKLTSPPAAPANAVIDTALAFNGVDDHVVVPYSPSLQLTHEATLSAWVRFDALPSELRRSMALVVQAGVATDLDIKANEDDKFHFYVATGHPHHVVWDEPINRGQWYHVAATYKANDKIVLYVDGIAKEKDIRGVQRQANGNPLTFAKDPIRGALFQGQLADIRVWNVALMQDKIRYDMGRRLTGKEQGLVGYWPFQEGKGNLTNDLTTIKNNGQLRGTIAVNPKAWVKTKLPELGQRPKLPFSEPVRLAIDKGVNYLKSAQKPDGAWDQPGVLALPGGFTALALLALLESGVPTDDPAVKKGLDFLWRQVVPEKTYVVALQTMVFARANPTDYQPFIKRNVDWLLDTRLRDEKGLLTGWTYDKKVNGPSDNSNSQYAVMALHEARRAGVKIDPKVWKEIRDYYLRTQFPDGGWAYSTSGGGIDGINRTTLTMTCAGICGLLITQKNLNDKDASRDAAVAKGLKFLGDSFTVNNAKRKYYSLYGIARTGGLSGRRIFAQHDWYDEGSQLLLRSQEADGSWSEPGHFDQFPVVSTSFALMFLAKGE